MFRSETLIKARKNKNKNNNLLEFKIDVNVIQGHLTVWPVTSYITFSAEMDCKPNSKYGFLSL